MRVLLIIICFLSFETNAGTHFLEGDISNITSSRLGLSIQLNTGVPDNCQGTPYGWMIIKAEDKVMISVALAAWTSGKKRVTIYTDGKDSSGYCIVNQFDPKS